MFFDRHSAGRQLAGALEAYTNSDAIVYALPRGGVVVGRAVAAMLGLPLDIVIARKVGHPANPEVAICAITEDGDYLCNEYGLGGVDREWVMHALARQQAEAARRREVYKHGLPVRVATGKTAIIVDDGIATGLTMHAAVHAIKKQTPAHIVIAVPVAPAGVLAEFTPEVDAVVVLRADSRFRGVVGSYYTHFPQVSDLEVMTCLADAQVDTLRTELQAAPPSRSMLTKREPRS